MKVLHLKDYFTSLGTYLRVFSAITALSLSCISSIYAQTYQIAEKGANHRNWERIMARTNEQGEITYRTNKYVELATGLNHLVGGQWVESSDDIQITSTGGAATNSQHQVYFAANINTPGSIEVVTPHGRHLAGTVLGLSLYDSASGKSVVIAQVQDSIGQILASANQVLYTNALGDSQSDFQADILYTHKRNSFEQDVILHQQPPSPVDLGLNPDTTLIQVWTEYYNANDPEVSTNTISVSVLDNGRLNRRALANEILNFGSMQMDQGNGYATDGSTNTIDSFNGALLIPIAKHWVSQNGHKYLVEQVPFNAVAQQLGGLPAAVPANNGAGGTNGSQSFFRSPLKTDPKLAKSQSLLFAANNTAVRPGLVLDYLFINNSVTNFTFQSDTTYLISGTVNLYSNTVVEGGTVIKCGTSLSANNVMNGNVQWLTAPYRPAIFTCTNDDSVGEQISGSSGHPSMLVASAFYCANGGSVTNARFSYLWNGIGGGAATIDITDCQFVYCNNPITVNTTTTTLGLHNVLIAMDDSQNNSTNYCSCPPGALTIYSTALRCYGENVTADLGSQFFIHYISYNPNPSLTTFAFTNSIIIAPHPDAYYNSGAVGITTTTNATYYATTKPSGLFQTVGGASYYLDSDSPARGVGVAGISPTTLADIGQKTTYPPIVFALQTITNNLILFPQAQRDTNAYPDIGYHYDPLDFAFGHVQMGSNTTLTITPGTAVAYFRTNGTAFGLRLLNNCAFLSQGTPTTLNRQVEFAAVQELSVTNWAQLGTGGEFILTDDLNTIPTTFNCLFNDFSIIALDTYPFYCEGTTSSGPINLQNCQFHGGYLEVDEDSCNFTNCLWERVNMFLDLDVGQTLFVRNNLFWGGSYEFFFSSTSSLFQNNVFYRTSLSDLSSASTYVEGNNAYYTNSGSLRMTSGTDKTITTTFNYLAGPLGNYYLTTNSVLIDVGNTNANLVGLYHYTTQTNQVKETNSLVDIGYHYVALNSYGQPMDSDADGLPDYFEDSNGNGLLDSGETDWTNAADVGFKVYLTQPKNNSVIP